MHECANPRPVTKDQFAQQLPNHCRVSHLFVGVLLGVDKPEYRRLIFALADEAACHVDQRGGPALYARNSIEFQA